MKQLFFILIFFTSLGAQAQSIKIDDLIKINPIKITKYQFPKNRNTFLRLPMIFSSSTFEKTYIQNSEFNHAKTVILVYSKYKHTNHFEQEKLNRKRFENLKEKVPHLFNNSKINWVIYEQQEKNIQAARKLYHGFVILLKPPTPNRKSEIKWMDSIMNTAKDTHLIIAIKQPCRITKQKHYTGKFYPKSHRKKTKGIFYNNAGLWNRTEQFYIKNDTLCPPDKIMRLKSKSFNAIQFQDSTVIKVLKRHGKNWGNSVIVQDVTGSMSPFMMQTLIWLNLATEIKKPNQFVFFNDGDNKPNDVKIIGKVGGVYPIKSNNTKEIQNAMTKAALKGSGGDGPENDLEAIVKAEKQFPLAKNTVLIADNLSGVKDLNLLWKLNKPVHIILCGYMGYIHPDYLLIARQTNGTVHTIEQDITNLSNQSEGSVFTIGDIIYTIKHGEIMRIKSTKL